MILTSFGGMRHVVGTRLDGGILILFLFLLFDSDYGVSFSLP
jgi:hypothetical protein